MTTIYLIDDDYRRHQKLNLLVRKLNASPSSKEYACAICPEDENAAREHAYESTKPENVWRAVSTSDADSIFLIDLKLGALEENQAREDLFRFLASSSSSWKSKANALISEEDARGDWSCKTALFACAVLKAREIAAIIVSTAASVAEVKRFGRDFGIPPASLDDIEVSPAGTPAYNSASISELEREILKLRRHTDPVIRGILASYFDPIFTDQNYWMHDLTYFDVRLLGKRVWGFDSITDTENKALHCRGEKWTTQGPRGISREILESALKALKLDCTIDLGGIGSDTFYFPLQPGIMFLLSLRELTVAMTADDGNAKFRPLPQAVRFGRSGKVMFVSIELDAVACADFAMLKRLSEKGWKTYDGRINDRLPDGGLSEASFHLGHVRLGGIKGREPWAMMFKDGSKDWAAWPSFEQRSISFHWHI